MKFAHMSDCHVGGWREERLKELSILAFEQAINECIKENVAFVLISGDLFNTSLPNIDIIKRTAQALDKLRENDGLVKPRINLNEPQKSGQVGTCVPASTLKPLNLSQIFNFRPLKSSNWIYKKIEFFDRF